MAVTPLFSLSNQGIETSAKLHWNYGTAQLVEAALANGEGQLAKDGPLVVKTGAHTGRSAKDKFIVRDQETEDTIWWGKTNVGMEPAHFAALKEDFLTALAAKKELYVADLYGGSQAEHRVNVRVVNEFAWHNLFIRTLLVRPEQSELAGFTPEYTIIDLPSFRHPLRAAYVLGPGKGSLSPELLERCQYVVKIPTRFCVNVAMAGAIVMYDRVRLLAPFQERPVSQTSLHTPADLSHSFNANARSTHRPR